MDMEEITSNAQQGIVELVRSAGVPDKVKKNAGERLLRMIEHLDPEDVEWAALRFGLIDGHPWSHEELAAQLGVPVEIVAATERRILTVMSDRKKGFLWPTS